MQIIVKVKKDLTFVVYYIFCIRLLFLFTIKNQSSFDEILSGISGVISILKPVPYTVNLNFLSVLLRLIVRIPFSVFADMLKIIFPSVSAIFVKASASGTGE